MDVSDLIAEERRISGQRCYLSVILGAMPPELKAGFEDVIYGDSDTSQAQIVRAINKWAETNGVDKQADVAATRRHRLNGCVSCGRKPVDR